MKKVILSLLMCIMALSASAQLKTFDAKLNLRGDLGLGAGVTLGLTNSVDLAPSVNIYFGDGTCFTLDGDFHLNLPVGDEFTVYPLVGPAIFHNSYDHRSWSKLGVNLGCGGRYNVTNTLDIFAELKYQFLFDADGFDDTFFTVGVSFPI